MSRMNLTMDSFVARAVPLSVKSRLWFGGWTNQFGWAWLAFSSIFVWAFTLSFGGLRNPTLPKGPTATVDGVVAAVDKTNTTINGSRVMAYKFEYRAEDGQPRTAVHHGYAGRYELKQVVPVQYSIASPEVAVIKGACDDFGSAMTWILLLIAIFPAVGVGFVVVGLVKGLRGMSLLRRGKLTYGELVDVSATNVKINNSTVYKYTFEFAADGQVFRAAGRSHRTGVFEGEDGVPESCISQLATARQADGRKQPPAVSRNERVERMRRQADLAHAGRDRDAQADPIFEPLMYDPQNPERAVMLDDLPGGPRLDTTGQIRPAGLAALPTLILPLITLAGNAAALFILLSRGS